MLVYLAVLPHHLSLSHRSCKMTKEYTVTEYENHKVISYEENGFLYSFLDDPENPDYQRYLNPEAEQSTPIDTGDE